MCSVLTCDANIMTRISVNFCKNKNLNENYVNLKVRYNKFKIKKNENNIHMNIYRNMVPLSDEMFK